MYAFGGRLFVLVLVLVLVLVVLVLVLVLVLAGVLFVVQSVDRLAEWSLQHWSLHERQTDPGQP